MQKNNLHVCGTEMQKAIDEMQKGRCVWLRLGLCVCTYANADVHLHLALVDMFVFQETLQSQVSFSCFSALTTQKGA